MCYRLACKSKIKGDGDKPRTVPICTCSVTTGSLLLKQIDVPEWAKYFRCRVIKPDTELSILRKIAGKQQAKDRAVQSMTFAQSMEFFYDLCKVIACFTQHCSTLSFQWAIGMIDRRLTCLCTCARHSCIIGLRVN